METVENIYTEDRSLGFTTLVYCAVMLVAFVIGLYGLFSLLSLAAETVGRNVQLL
jgi:hypothetical protein